MNGYSRISNDSSHKSRSMDFSDAQTPFHESPKASRNSGAVKAEVEERNKEDEGDKKGQRFGVILGRSASVSCSASSSSGFQVTMKRAFSMRRSSSVSERYRRIHDQYTVGVGGNHQMDTARSKKNQRAAAKILKACKRLLGL